MSDNQHEAKEANLRGQETSTLLIDRPTSAGERESGEEETLETSNMESDISESPPSSPVGGAKEKPEDKKSAQKKKANYRPPPPTYDDAMARSSSASSPQVSSHGRNNASPASSVYNTPRSHPDRCAERSVSPGERVPLNKPSSSSSASPRRSLSPGLAVGVQRAGGSSTTSGDEPSQSPPSPPSPPSRSSSIEVMNRFKNGGEPLGASIGAPDRAINPSDAAVGLTPIDSASSSNITVELDTIRPSRTSLSSAAAGGIASTDNPNVVFKGTTMQGANGDDPVDRMTSFSPSLQDVETGGESDKHTWRDTFKDRRCVIISSAVCVALAFLIFIIIMPVSFVTVEYYEVALKRIRSTRVLERNDTYYYGCYIIGPDAEFMKFPATAQTLQMDLTVYTVERLEVSFAISLQYFLRPEEVGDLYLKFGPEYASVLSLLVEAAMKNRMIYFTLDDFRNDRANVDLILHQTAHRKLGGNCCLSCCARGNCEGRQLQLCDGCTTRDTCDHGYHTDVLYFQLLDLTMPPAVTERILNQLVLQVESETEFFIQTKKLTEIKTEQMVQAKQNQANELGANATAWGNYYTTVAAADADKERQLATMAGLQDVYRRLDLQQEDHQLSYYWISMLGKKEIVKLNSVAFDKSYVYTG